MTVAVLMATFDGAAHLPAQLDSLFAQTVRDWTLAVRDDGSTDGTQAILDDYARRFPGRIRRLETPAVRMGAKGSFGALLQECTSDAIFFADQDDVWLPHKIERSLAVLNALEDAHGRDTPMLVHTDLRPVDASLAPLTDSYWRYHGLDFQRGERLGRLLVRNVVTGCATLVNRPLRDLALPLPDAAFMHDWWLALVASAFGRVQAIPEATVLYRQHAANAIGARPPRLSRLPSRERVRTYYARTRAQACAFSDRFGARLTPPARQAVEDYCGLETLGAWSRRAATLRGGFRDDGLLRNLAMLLLA